jgi:hypothetical protein
MTTLKVGVVETAVGEVVRDGYPAPPVGAHPEGRWRGVEDQRDTESDMGRQHYFGYNLKYKLYFKLPHVGYNTIICQAVSQVSQNIDATTVRSTRSCGADSGDALTPVAISPRIT